MAKRRKRTSGSGGGLLVLCVAAFFGLSYVAEFITWYGVGAVLVVLTVLVFWVVTRRSIISTPKAQDLLTGYHAIGSMSGGQFEVFVAQVLRGMGYKTTVLGGSGDQGVDVIAIGANGRVAIQCKNYARTVGNKPVQEVYAGSKHHLCEHAWVVAPKGYTKGAHELARSVGVKLFDADSIRQWIKAVDNAERQNQRQATPV